LDLQHFTIPKNPNHIFSKKNSIHSTIFIQTAANVSVRNFAKKMGLPRVFFDMSADGQPLGRIIIEVSIISINLLLFRRKIAKISK
jgi:hypothetical protein